MNSSITKHCQWGSRPTSTLPDDMMILMAAATFDERAAAIAVPERSFMGRFWGSFGKHSMGHQNIAEVEDHEGVFFRKLSKTGVSIAKTCHRCAGEGASNQCVDQVEQ